MSKAKIAITLDEGTLRKVRAAVRAHRAASVSAYISQAVAKQTRDDSMERLIADLKRERGEPPRKAIEWAKRVLGS